MTTEQMLRAIITYCEGVKSDFPELTPAMNNIISMAKEGLASLCA